MKRVSLSIDALRESIEQLPSDSLHGARIAALQHLQEHGLPTTREEDWKYSDLTPAIELGNRWLSGNQELPPVAETHSLIKEIRDSFPANWLVVADGQVDAESLAVFQENCGNGVSVTRLSDSDEAISFTEPLSNLNAALLRDGLRIHVDEGTRVATPIGLLFVDHAATSPGMTQSRIDIELADASEAAFLEFHASLGPEDHYANAVNSLSIGDAARASYVRIQDRSLVHMHTNRFIVNCGRDCQFDHFGVDFGGHFVRNDLVIDMRQPHSRINFNGLYLAGDDQHIDNHTRVDHRVGPAESWQEYRGILAGPARAVWNGKAIVHKGADGTDAKQANHNLMLSENCEIDAKPELEIYADDVKCSHGTTVGQLDEDALFYLRTRGLSKHDAKRALTTAFAMSLVSKMPVLKDNEHIVERVAQRLDEMMLGGDA